MADQLWPVELHSEEVLNGCKRDSQDLRERLPVTESGHGSSSEP